MENTDITIYPEFLLNFKKLQEALLKINQHFSQDLYRVCANSSEELKLDFKTFNKTFSDKSEMCMYSDGVIMLSSKLKNFIEADREDNQLTHLHAIQDFLPTFANLTALMVDITNTEHLSVSKGLRILYGARKLVCCKHTAVYSDS